MGKSAAMAKPKGKELSIPPINLGRLTLRLVSDSPLICHQFSSKAKQSMLDKQMKKPTQAKQAKDPEAEDKASLYPHPDGGYGFPCSAFKNAAVDACSHADGITKVVARGAFNVIGDLVKIIGKPSMREDTVIIGMGVADIRYRG